MSQPTRSHGPVTDPTTAPATGAPLELEDTDAGAIAAQFVEDRRRAGSPAMGMVMTLVIVVDDPDEVDDAMTAAGTASHEHPARVLGVVRGAREGPARVDARVGTGGASPGETAVIRLHGEVVDHAESVVLPLLLPDSPVVVWWPADAPDDPAGSALGQLGQRRITDAAADTRPGAMLAQCTGYAPGNTDLAWTRITPWRALLAAARDQHPARVSAGTVTAEDPSPSADLLAAWLSGRLDAPVGRATSEGPGITAVRLETSSGTVSLTREDGVLATLATPGRPDRPVALKRRGTAELLAEELRRLDPDELYAETVRRMAESHDEPGQP